jgi:uncharacterized protein YfbU (UPF0304 family)
MDRKDRFIISNQLKILEALYPEEASSYAQARTAFEEGYESHYDWAMEHILQDPLTPEMTKEVIDTLDMFRAIYFYNRKHGEDGFSEYDTKFRGYDGNDPTECKLLGYARYFVVELGRFSEILEKQGEHFDFNSHMEMREKYQRMLRVWRPIPGGAQEGQRHNLTKQQLESIINA